MSELPHRALGQAIKVQTWLAADRCNVLAGIGEPIAGARVLGKLIALPDLQQALAAWLPANAQDVTRAAYAPPHCHKRGQPSV